MSAAVNSMIGAQSDLIGRGAEGSEFREESGSLESRVSQSAGLVFGSIAVGIAAPEAESNHPSSIGAVGSELRVKADAGAASRALFGGRTRSCSSYSAARSAVARIRRRSSPRGCQPCSLNFQI